MSLLIGQTPVGNRSVSQLGKQIGFHGASERVGLCPASDPTTPTPAPAAGAASTRDRVLDVTAQLFCQQDIHIGVDTSCRAAGLSTRSTYQLFGSDDQLMAAGLRERTGFGSEALLLPADDDRPPRARILHASNGWKLSNEVTTSVAVLS
ncbi:TetR/AcrR family transcriptional regulator [Streptomyces sp. NPDC020794]|uniref:TetR/AcrR family transcriptional regulator n=1 Tax=unclassified Streptomyces TaxID=2593676 RepID=UPI0036E4A29F